ncbi:MAG TPA: GAF and ANTAR domain-containing protein [Acidimicrobiales bacterium]|nr:GAF and ANTAR domain-containing protein [Acidimicrobiales bacterium]
MNDDRTADAISEIAGLVHADSSFSGTMSRLLAMAQEAVPAADAAGLTIVDEHGRPGTPYYSDEISPHVDEAQYASGRGPCLDAWRQLRTVRIDRMDDAREDYPEFAETAERAGVLSTLSLPVMARGRGVGAVNFDALREAAFTEADEQSADAVLGPISASIANATAYWEAHDLSDHLREAMASRAIIEQAKGIIMSSMGCDADAAFQVLRQQSQAENRKLREIAQELVNQQHR